MSTESQNEKTSVSIKLDFVHLLRTLVAIVLGLLFMHIVLQYLFWQHDIEIFTALRQRLDVDNEVSIPTWFSQLLLLVPAILGYVLYRSAAARKAGIHYYWALLGLLFLFLSADEGASLHEAFVQKLREANGLYARDGFVTQIWLIPVGLALLLMLVPFILFIKQLPKQTATFLSAGMAIYVLGAIIYESIGLVSFANVGFAYKGLNVALEEGLEMTGVCVVIYAMLTHARATIKKVTISLT